MTGHGLFSGLTRAKGMKPGVEFGVILDKAFEAQLEGAFTEIEGALKWLDQQV